MKKLLILALSLCAAYTSNAQKLKLINTSCTDVNIVLHADDGTLCGPATVDASATIFLATGTSITYNFNNTTVGINTGAGGNFVWASTGTAGAPSFQFASTTPPIFNFFKADVWSSCTTWPPVSGICGGAGGPYIPGPFPLDGLSVINPSCGGASSLLFVNAATCGSCVPCSRTCTPPPNSFCSWHGHPVNVAFNRVGSDWEVTVN